MSGFLPNNDVELGDLLLSKWHQYKKSILIFLLALFGGVFAWQQHTTHVVEQSREASLLMNNMIDLVKNNQSIDQIKRLEHQLSTQYTQTPYAPLAKMILAKKYIKQEKWDQAIEQYTTAISINHDPAINQIAHLRLARLQLAQSHAQKALDVLKSVDHWDFPPIAKEIEGDAYLQLKQYHLAKSAYDKALETLPQNPTWQNVAIRLGQKQNHAKLSETGSKA